MVSPPAAPGQTGKEFAPRRAAALPVLLIGAAGIGCAPILVRWSEAGPVATAFHRLLWALPLLALIHGWEERRPAGRSSGSRGAPVSSGWFILAGALFAGDMAFWHWSLKLTTVANATLLTNLAPILVALGASALFRERLSTRLIIGMGAAFFGGTLLIRESSGRGAGSMEGDLLALTAAFFYAGYLLSIKFLRRRAPTSAIMLRAGVVSCVLLGATAVFSGETLLPTTWKGWLTVVALGWISHVGGQGLIAYSLAHLRAGFSALSLLLQPVVASALAWALLNESISAAQAAGGGVILMGIALASRDRNL